ncbi:MAG: glycoside hydrolase family 55 protein [Kiritimatiellae bacterium]|nr:glycoside hydrolase family 55 protein [Kiritimatiellia bacterium]
MRWSGIRFGVVAFGIVLMVVAANAAGLNVRDFGAAGDGIADDTAAIQRAADAAYKARGADAHCMTRNLKGGIDAPFAAVLFPSGTYRLTRPVDFKWNVALLGEKGARLVQECPTNTLFHFSESHRLIVQGLEFDGGSIQLKCWTKNRDVSYLHVADCVFRNASATALVCDSHKDAQGVCREDATIPYNNSTLILVERCLFRDNATALHLYSDGTTVRDCQFLAPSAARKEQIRAGSGGRLGVEMSFRDCTIDYPGSVAPDTAAIRYDGGRVTFENCTVSAREALVAVRSHSRFNEYGSPSMLDLLNVRLSTGAAPVVSCVSNDFPNRILACELVNLQCGRKRLVAFDREPTRDAIDEKMAHAQTARCIPAENCLAFMTRGLAPAEFDTTLPSELEKYRREAAPAAWTRPLQPRSGVSFARDLPQGKVFRDESIGHRRRHDAGDDTDKVAALLAAAEANGGGVVELPARWIRVSHGFRLPNHTRVTCPGRAALDMADGDGVFFRVAADEAPDAAFERILFVEGGSVLVSESTKGRVRFLDCAFYGQKAPALLASASTANAFTLDVTGGQAYAPYLYRGNAEVTFDAFWYQELTERPKGEFRAAYAAIVNEVGGRLTLREMLGVPCYFVNMSKSEAYSQVHLPAQNGEIRWIDNHGTLLSLNTRYGGEWGGLTPIYHFGSANTFIEGGVMELNGGLMRSGRAIVVADSATPNVTVCRGVAGTWRSPVQVVRKTATGEYEVLANVRVGGCAPFSCYGAVWPKEPEGGEAASVRFAATFAWDGLGCPRLEMEAPHRARVWLNGKDLGEKGDFCAPWECAYQQVWRLPAQKGANALEIEMARVCTNAACTVQGGYFSAQVICGEHALAISGLGGDFHAVPPRPLKPCPMRRRLKRQ